MKKEVSQIETDIKEYMIQHFFKNKQIQEIDYNTPLISGGLLDSISTMQLVSFLESKFGIEFEAHEVDKDNFETIAIIADFVNKKQ